MDTQIESLNEALVNLLKARDCIRSETVEAAFRSVNRHHFLPDLTPEEVYKDQAIPTKRLDDQVVSSSSQPAIMAQMLEQLQLKPGHRVLEIGAGTGYNAALMAHIVGEHGHVVTIDIDDDIVEAAQAHLQAAGADQVQVICADGGYGFAEVAPYDRIILTVGAWDIMPAWLEQLKPEGLLVLPLSLKGGIQESIAFQKKADHLHSLSIESCGFMRMRGAFADPMRIIQLGSEPGLALGIDSIAQQDATQVFALLSGDWQEIPVPNQFTNKDLWAGLLPWLALHDDRYCTLHAMGSWADQEIVPVLIQFSNQQKIHVSNGLLQDERLVLLARTTDTPKDAPQFQISLCNYGPDDRLARQLLGHLEKWEQAGRPSATEVSIRVYPQDSTILAANAQIVPKRFSQLVIDW